MIIHWKIGPKTSSKQRCRIHRKYQEIDAKMEPKSMKNPLKIHPKIEVRKRTVQNREKSRPGAPKGRKCRYDCPAGLAILSRWVPTNQQKERGLYSRDPTRQWAVGPANFCSKKMDRSNFGPNVIYFALGITESRPAGAFRADTIVFWPRNASRRGLFGG